MRLGYTIIYASDVEKTLLFYERAFGLKTKFLHESHEYGELETGTTTLAFASEDLLAKNNLTFRLNIPTDIPAGFEIAFVTSDVQTAYDKAIAAGATSLKAPAQKPWGQTVGYVRDLNGVLVELCSPMG